MVGEGRGNVLPASLQMRRVGQQELGGMSLVSPSQLRIFCDKKDRPGWRSRGREGSFHEAADSSAPSMRQLLHPLQSRDQGSSSTIPKLPSQLFSFLAGSKGRSGSTSHPPLDLPAEVPNRGGKLPIQRCILGHNQPLLPPPPLEPSLPQGCD